MINFDEYIRQGDPGKREKASAWRTAVGLQAVDGLTVSDYLQETAQRHIEGEISIKEVKKLIKTFYETKFTQDDNDNYEADTVSSNITDILATRTLDFTTHGFKSLHRQIFNGVFKHAGEFRTYDISKHEWVLRGASVLYLGYTELQRAMDYDIAQERAFSYTRLTIDEIVAHITRFVAGIWQIHPFGEGNTRTTAVFAIQYLRSLGFDVDSEVFALHSLYFRNALVRANYKSVTVDYEFKFLERFFRNLLLGEQHELKNCYMLINAEEQISKSL